MDQGSDETNNKIKDKAPADYLVDPEVFPSGANAALLEPHFLDTAATKLLAQAREDLSNEQVAELYAAFIQARQAAMIAEIRSVCGITKAAEPDAEPTELEDEPAADVIDGTAPILEEEDESVPEAA